MSDPSSDTEDVRSLLILYATETGNAQDAADYIARECRRIRFQCRVASVDSYSLVRSLALYLSLNNIAISDGSHFRKYCCIRRIYHWFWCRTSIHDSYMDKPPSFRSATWHIWGSALYSLRSWRHGLRKILLGCKETITKIAVLRSHGVPWTWWSWWATSSWVSNRSPIMLRN